MIELRAVDCRYIEVYFVQEISHFQIRYKIL